MDDTDSGSPGAAGSEDAGEPTPPAAGTFSPGSDDFTATERSGRHRRRRNARRLKLIVVAVLAAALLTWGIVKVASNGSTPSSTSLGAK